MMVSDLSDLKPCPFCGGVAKLYREQGVGGINGSIVRCEKCGAKAAWKQMSYTTACDHEAIEAWNRRAKDERTMP